MAERINRYRELRVSQAAMVSALDIFDLTRRFPAEERYALTDQIRRSSRSGCANIAEAWRKRRYRAAFIAKLNDAESGAAETQVWGSVLIWTERGCVGDQPQRFPPAAADASRTAALRETAKSDTTKFGWNSLSDMAIWLMKTMRNSTRLTMASSANGCA